MNLEQVRNQKEQQAAKDSAQVKYALAVLSVALRAIRGAATAGNVQCIEGLKEILKIKKP